MKTPWHLSPTASSWCPNSMWQQILSPDTFHPMLETDSGACSDHQRPGKTLGLCLGCGSWHTHVLWMLFLLVGVSLGGEGEKFHPHLCPWSTVSYHSWTPIHQHIHVFPNDNKITVLTCPQIEKKPSGISNKVLEASMKPPRWGVQLMSLASLLMFYMHRLSKSSCYLK